MKTCFKCGHVKAIEEFYVHPQMWDGHLNKCKQCTKLDVRNNYAAKRLQIAEYDRMRNKTQHRKEQRLRAQTKRRKLFPQKNRARNAVSNALRSGRIKRNPCEVCGHEKVQAHHADYSKPLDVQWLCFKCHREIAHGQVVNDQTD